MNTQYTSEQMGFHAFGRREVVGNFDGGRISSDGGAMPLRETEQRTGILARVAAQFTDHRDPMRRDHSVRELVSQRALAQKGSRRTSKCLFAKPESPARHPAETMHRKLRVLPHQPEGW